MTDGFRIEHIGIPAKGPLFDETVAFYENLFGFKRIREVTGAQRFTFLSDGQGGAIEILDVDGAPSGPPGHLAFAFDLSEFDTVQARLQEQGLVFDSVGETSVGDRLAYFRDPAGNVSQIVGRKVPLE